MNIKKMKDMLRIQEKIDYIQSALTMLDELDCMCHNSENVNSAKRLLQNEKLALSEELQSMYDD